MDMAEESPSPQALERKLATILSADVAAYSRLMAEDEEQTLRTFRAHVEIFQSLVVLHRGRIFNTAGDAILAEFGSAVEAVRCATEIQAALRTRNDQLPPSRQVRFRIGVNLGDVMVQGQDLLGDGVNVAARLQSAAEPGGICISGSVYDQIRNKLSLSFKSLGEKSFKNIPQTVRTFSITEAEGYGALPAPENERRALAGNWAKWLIAAVLLFVVAGGYWAFSQNHRAKLEQARVLVETKRQTAEREAKAAAEQRAAEDAQRRAQAERASAEAARRELQAEAERAEAARKKTEAGVQVVAVPPEPPRPLANAPAAAGAVPDGLYAGPICYGPAPADPARCFRAQATISRGRIAGQWSGRDPGVTMFIVGEVSASGEAKIHMHSEKPDGTRIATIDLAGTLKDGRLDATGSFRNGRTASLNWRKSATGAR
jgi:class 3 adenylate cyclase/cbb3-type cytochrome oxidase subunit 3